MRLTSLLSSLLSFTLVAPSTPLPMWRYDLGYQIVSFSNIRWYSFPSFNDRRLLGARGKSTSVVMSPVVTICDAGFDDSAASDDILISTAMVSVAMTQASTMLDDVGEADDTGVDDLGIVGSMIGVSTTLEL
jgi:hypothetical protein